MATPLWSFAPSRTSAVPALQISALLAKLLCRFELPPVQHDLTVDSVELDVEQLARVRRLASHLATVLDSFELPARVELRPSGLSLLWTQPQAPDAFNTSDLPALTRLWLRHRGVLLPERPYQPWTFKSNFDEEAVVDLVGSFRSLAAELRS